MRVRSRILFQVRSRSVSSGPESNHLYENPEPYFISSGAGAELILYEGPEPNYYFILMIIILLFLARLCWAAVSQRPRRIEVFKSI